MNYDAFLQHICPRLDLNWRKYRRRAARHRLHARMTELRVNSYEQYLAYLADNPNEAKELPDRLRITVSRFFREREQWETAGRIILPHLLKSIIPSTNLRIWSVGCCGGEEPYTIALLWLACLQTIDPATKIDILATDIDDASLARAKRAIYARNTLHEMPAFLFHSYFTAAGNQWLLAEAAKKLVRFKNHNLMKDPAPQNVDFICCRYYVFTYYTGKRLQLAMTRLHSALSKKGVLMIGRRENMGPGNILFVPWDQEMCYYRPVTL